MYISFVSSFFYSKLLFDLRSEAKCKSLYMRSSYRKLLNENEYFIKQILKSGTASSATLIDLVSEQIILDVKAHLKGTIKSRSLPETAPEILTEAYTGAMIYCGRHWIMQEKRTVKELVIKQFTNIIDKLLS